MGNRGILHDAERRLVRDWQVRRWIACHLEFHERHRSVMTPGTTPSSSFWTKPPPSRMDTVRAPNVATPTFGRFRPSGATSTRHRPPSADAIDRVLHAERRVRPFLKRTHFAQIDTLPDGSYVMLDGARLVGARPRVWAWTPDRYVESVPASGRQSTSRCPDPSVDCQRCCARASSRPCTRHVNKMLDSSTLDCFVLLSRVDTRQLRWRTTPAGRESGVDRDVSRGL